MPLYPTRFSYTPASTLNRLAESCTASGTPLVSMTGITCGRLGQHFDGGHSARDRRGWSAEFRTDDRPPGR
jgi:hypothetical protein